MKRRRKRYREVQREVKCLQPFKICQLRLVKSEIALKTEIGIKLEYVWRTEEAD